MASTTGKRELQWKLWKSWTVEMWRAVWQQSRVASWRHECCASVALTSPRCRGGLTAVRQPRTQVVVRG
eukprot:1533743-Amphidinium_carterae.1